MKAHKLSENHLQTRWEWINSPAIYATMNFGPSISLEQTGEWFRRAAANPERIDFAFTDGPDIVAMSGLTGLDRENSMVEYYVMVGPGFQGKGYGNQATRWSLNYAFSKLGVNKVYLYTNAFNERANKLYENLGFVLEARMRQHKLREGKLIDRCMYGMLREDWVKQPYCNEPNDLEP